MIFVSQLIVGFSLSCCHLQLQPAAVHHPRSSYRHSWGTQWSRLQLRSRMFHSEMMETSEQS